MLEPFVQESEKMLTIPSWQSLKHNLVVGFSTKNGGVSEGHFTSLNMGLHVMDDEEAVCQNKRILADSIKFPTSNWVGCDQVHEARIEKVDETSIGKGVFSYESAIPKTDGIYTNQAGILLTLCFADCVPLYFLAPEQSYIGVAHAGWKGTVKNIGALMVEKWREEGIHPEQIKVAIGPSISPSSYVVDDYVLQQVKAVLPDTSHAFVYKEVATGQYELDLKRVNKELLLLAGVKEENISCSSFCTSTHEELFFSHRRDSGKTGRMMSFIGWKGVQENE